MVALLIVHAPHAADAHDAIQSAQSGSCSAPTTSVPPFTGFPCASVVDESPPPELESSSSPPHAAATNNNAISSAMSLASARRSRTYVLLGLGWDGQHPPARSYWRRNAKITVVKANTTATPTVMRSRFRSITVEPAADVPLP